MSDDGTIDFDAEATGKAFDTPEPPREINTRIVEGKKKATNWAAAFVLFCKGASYEEIEAQFGVTDGRVRARARAEDWRGLAAQLPALAPPRPPASIAPVDSAKAALALKKVEDNRAEQLERTTRILERIDAMLDKGTYQGLVKYKDSYELAELPFSPKEIRDLSQAHRVLTETRMLLLGDERSGGVAGAARAAVAAGANGANGPQINIFLPSVVGEPRRVKAVEAVHPEVSEGVMAKDAPLVGLETKPVGIVKNGRTRIEFEEEVPPE